MVNFPLGSRTPRNPRFQFVGCGLSHQVLWAWLVIDQFFLVRYPCRAIAAHKPGDTRLAWRVWNRGRRRAKPGCIKWRGFLGWWEHQPLSRKKPVPAACLLRRRAGHFRRGSDGFDWGLHNSYVLHARLLLHWLHKDWVPVGFFVLIGFQLLVSVTHLCFMAHEACCQAFVFTTPVSHNRISNPKESSNRLNIFFGKMVIAGGGVASRCLLLRWLIGKLMNVAT